MSGDRKTLKVTLVKSTIGFDKKQAEARTGSPSESTSSGSRRTSWSGLSR